MAGAGDLPPPVDDRLRAVCLGLPGSYEELAWTGVRWRVRGRTFAHACTVEPGHPTSHARVFATDGPVCVVTFRAPADEVAGLIGSGFPFYWPGWGVNVVGMVLEDHTDWAEVAELLTDSYLVQAPKKLARLVERPPARHSETVDIAQDRIAWNVTDGGQQWQIAWHPPPAPPEGTPHGSAAICLAADKLVLISSDGHRWGFPGGRPEDGEDWLDVLKREIREEACAAVTSQRLLGYSLGHCVDGHQAGLTLVRAWWAATVDLQPWQPQHEITHRKLVTPDTAYDSIWIEDGYAPLYRRILAEAIR